MSPSQNTCQMYLAALYRADVMGRGSYTQAMEEFRRDLTADADLRSATDAALRQHQAISRARPQDWATKKQMAYLQEALAA